MPNIPLHTELHVPVRLLSSVLIIMPAVTTVRKMLTAMTMCSAYNDSMIILIKLFSSAHMFDSYMCSAYKGLIILTRHFCSAHIGA